MFHAVTRAWFEKRFVAPTAVQDRAWPLIASGQDTLVTAPTGSGKTLAAFLASLDDLVRRGINGSLEEKTYVLYVSPLKALSNDVRRNLEDPLAGLVEMATEMGHPALPIRAAVRTGDTSAKERQQVVRRPPHILVTTPESLFILLTSESGRRGLRSVRTVIVDEIHALCADKRGAHLALSLERLAHLVDGPLQRVGLSATIEPLAVAARLLVGTRRPAPAIVDTGEIRTRDLGVEILNDELGAVCTNEQWGEIYERLTTLAQTHKSTLVFVNTRRLVERVALHLGERLGADTVAAHHGSLSRDRRFLAEQRLKSGLLKVVVATASLELGIDIGAVDLVCLLGSPRSISTGLQRIGRSGHAVGGIPKGRLFPLTRDQLVECAALARAAKKGVLDAIAMRDAPLDILAQQIVAACGAEEWDEDALFLLVTGAAPYADLTRTDFDAIVDMASEGIATSRGRSGALLHRDAVHRKLRGRRGARLAALTSGGAIPDNAVFDVILEPEGTLIGNVEEDFAIESMAGDVMLLGNNSWRIRRVENGKVRVEDAAGQAPTIPFWFGESPGRSRELSAEVGALREELVIRATRDSAVSVTDWLMKECALPLPGACLLRDYVLTGNAALGAVPSSTCVIAERFFDESGGTQLVLHAPFGARINRAWGMALRKRFCRTFDFELQAAATDDGIVLSLSTQHSFPLEMIFDLVRPEQVDEVLSQAAIQAPMFETRWRWNATRSLTMLRHRGGKKVPPNLQRMRAQDLLAATFPGQVACQDNHGGGPIEIPDHPLVRETVRDCLTEAMDAAGFKRVLGDLIGGVIRRVSRELPEPSVFAHEILNANPYAFLDDAPLEERRSRAVSVRRGLPAQIADTLGRLDSCAIDDIVAQARPDPRGADELHDLLLDLGALPIPGASSALGADPAWIPYFEALRDTGRAAVLCTEQLSFWVAAERRSLAALVWPEHKFLPELLEPIARRTQAWSDHSGALAEIVRGHLALCGPITEAALANALAVSVSDIQAALAAVEVQGAIMRGQFTTPGAGTEWVDRNLLSRMNRRTVDRLRREIEAVEPADFIRFLLAWHHVKPGSQLTGREGLRDAIARLQGFEAAAGAWESEIFPARVDDFDPAWLDNLCLCGEVAWGRLEARADGSTVASRATPIGLWLRQDIAWILEPRLDLDDQSLSGKARDVLGFLRANGATFLDDILCGTRRLRTEIDDALWELVAAGRITGDGFSGLRSLLPAKSGHHDPRRSRWYARTSRRPRPPMGSGRWSVLTAPNSLPSEDRMEALARQYLRRYGVVFRDVLAREAHAPPWRELVRALRRLELQGEIRGGRLVAGFVGEQFALPEALESLRAIRRAPKTGDVISVSACDPLNLVGILTPGPRIAAHLGHLVTFRDGVPIDSSTVTAQGETRDLVSSTSRAISASSGATRNAFS